MAFDWLKRQVFEDGPTQDTSPHADSKGYPRLVTERMFAVHVPQISRIEEASFPYPWPVPAFYHCICNPQCIKRVVLIDDKVAGYIVLEKSPVSLQIVNLAIDPAHRKTGLGQLLINEQIAAITSRVSWQSFLAPVAESNLAAQLFFRSLGFRCISQPKRFFTTGETAYLFQYRVGDHPQKNSLHRNRLIATMQGGEVR
jgi:ribosomal-protein-alanine N-acetyltransferase